MLDRLALDLLSAWPRYAERDFWSLDADLGCYGTGYNAWGVQTNQKYVGAMAVLATDPEFDPLTVGAPRELVLERTLKAFRYSLATHHQGERELADGTGWGCTWISALGIERMMHGVDRLRPHLTEEDREALQTVIRAEADFLVGQEVVAGLWGDQGRNRPESNLWNGALCARAALMMPEARQACDWEEKAHTYFLNGISVEADAQSDAQEGGKRIGDFHRGANFLPNFGLDHHAYLNVGYMVICLSNVAMLHYGLPEDHPFHSLYHHAEDLWGVLRRLVFRNGRLCRIGGDTRQRYCYCQDYLLPVLVFAADVWQDPHAKALLLNQLDLIAQEQDYNDDGSFLSRRMAHLAQTNPYYLTRLESDKALCIALIRGWLTHLEVSPGSLEDFEDSVSGGWSEPEMGAVIHRSTHRIASFA